MKSAAPRAVCAFVLMLIVAMACTSVRAWPRRRAPRESPGTIPMVIRVYVYREIPKPMSRCARELVTLILARGGVTAEWQEGRAIRRGHAGDKPSAGEAAPVLVTLRLMDAPAKPSADTTSRTLGFAVLDPETGRGDLTTVYVNRVLTLARRAHGSPGELLGAVIAHEIGHVLLGSQQHGRSGVMQAEWSEHTLRLERLDRMEFTSAELTRIHARLRWVLVESALAQRLQSIEFGP